MNRTLILLPTVLTLSGISVLNNVSANSNIEKSSSLSSEYLNSYSRLTNVQKENAKQIYKTFKELGFSKNSAKVAVKVAYRESSLKSDSSNKQIDSVGFFNWSGKAKKQLLKEDPNLSTKGQMKFIKEYVHQLNKSKIKKTQFKKLQKSNSEKESTVLFSQYFLNSSTPIK